MSSRPPDAAEPRRPAEIARLHMARIVVEEDHPLPDVLRRLCEVAAETLEVARAGIWLLAADRKALRCANLFESPTQEHSQGVTFHITEFPEYLRAVSGRRALAIECAQSDPRVAELRDAYLVPLGITSTLDAPVIQQGELIGIVCLEHVGPQRDWTTEDRDFAMSVADAVTSKLQSAELLIARASLQDYASLVRSNDRFEVVGRLASGVAHDFRNLLTVVMGNASIISQCATLTPAVRLHARQIEEASERGAALIRDLLDFGREPTGAPRVLNVPDALARFLPLLQTAVGSLYQVTLTRDTDRGRVLIDPGNLERGILNLVLNARDAMPTGGAIRLHTAIEQTTETSGPPAAYVRVDVSDTGVGIKAHDRERIFEPFFTTKPPGKGSGLGLASVRRILDCAGGFVRVQSAVGEGTSFHLYFPRVTSGG